MVALASTLEGVTPAGTTLVQGPLGSGGNTGYASGDFFDIVVMTGGAGATLASDNSLAAPRGALTLKCATGVTAAQSYAMWSTSLTGSGLPQVWFRIYCYSTTAAPAVTWRLLALSTFGGTLCTSISLTTTGLIRVADTSSATVITTAAAITANQWFRLEGFVIGSATVGQVEVKLFKDPDAVVPTEVITSAATVNTAGTVGQLKIGQSGATTASYGPVYFDEPAVNDTGYGGIAPGLLGLAGSPVLAHSATGSVTGTWGPGQNRAPGNLLIACCSAGAATSVTSITLPAGWTNVDNNGNSGTANARYRICTRTAAGGDAAPNCTSTLSGTGAMDMVLLEVAGLSGAADVNDTGNFFQSGATAITLSAATFTTTAPAPTFSQEELALAFFAQERAAAILTFADAGTGWTKLLGGNGVSSVLQTALLIKNPGVATAVATGAFSTSTTAFGTLCARTFKSARLTQQVAPRNVTARVPAGLRHFATYR